MRRFGVAVLAIVPLFAAVGSLAAGGEAKEAAVAKDLQALKGTWRMSSKEENGKKLSEEAIKDVIATWDGSGRCTVRRGDRVIGAGAVKLDATKQPKTIDVTFTEGMFKGNTLLGIYEIEGDVFRVCITRPGDERPAEFSARVGSGCILIVYKREQK
jgi:uncharacterized protein (TIGR03067 family)